jgi:predicted nucleic acid-binding Zn ribbon protein
MNIGHFATDTRTQVKWDALLEGSPGESGTPRGYCEGCGLHIWSNGAYKIPRLKGRFCSILCLECELFGPGKCRWCGEKLNASAKFCGEACRKRSEQGKFGDGTRLLEFLARWHPNLYQHLIGNGSNVCLRCGAALAGKRNDARFCSESCSKAYRRTSRKSPKSGNSTDTDPVKSTGYEERKSVPMESIEEPISSNIPDTQ